MAAQRGALLTAAALAPVGEEGRVKHSSIFFCRID